MTEYPAPPAEVRDRLMEGDHALETHRIGREAVMVVHERESRGCFYSKLTEETGWYVAGHQEVDGLTQVFVCPTISGAQEGDL